MPSILDQPRSLRLKGMAQHISEEITGTVSLPISARVLFMYTALSPAGCSQRKLDSLDLCLKIACMTRFVTRRISYLQYLPHVKLIQWICSDTWVGGM